MVGRNQPGMYTMGIARTEKMRCLSGGRVDMDVSTVYFYKKRKWEKLNVNNH